MRHIFCQEGTFSIQKALFSNNWALFLAKKNNTWAKGHFFTKTDMIEGGHKVGNYQGQDGHCPPSMYVSLTPGRPDFWALVTRRGGVHYIGNFCFDWNFLLKSTANESYDKYHSNELNFGFMSTLTWDIKINVFLEISTLSNFFIFERVLWPLI